MRSLPSGYCWQPFRKWKQCLIPWLHIFETRAKTQKSCAYHGRSKPTPATLAEAFRGEFFPQDPNDEPASALLERIRQVQNGAAGTTRGRRRKGSQR